MSKIYRALDNKLNLHIFEVNGAVIDEYILNFQPNKTGGGTWILVEGELPDHILEHTKTVDPYEESYTAEDIGVLTKPHVKNGVRWVPEKFEKKGFCQEDGLSLGYSSFCGEVVECTFKREFLDVEKLRVKLLKEATAECQPSFKGKLIDELPDGAERIIGFSDIDDFRRVGNTVYETNYFPSDSTLYVYQLDADFSEFEAAFKNKATPAINVIGVAKDECPNLSDNQSTTRETPTINTAIPKSRNTLDPKPAKAKNTVDCKSKFYALAGTPKQREWGSAIRKEFLEKASEEQRQFLLDYKPAIKAKWWIENRHQISREIDKVSAIQKKSIEIQDSRDRFKFELKLASSNPPEADGSRTLKSGTKVWLDSRCRLHRDVREGPALIRADGTVFFYEDGVLVAPDFVKQRIEARP